MYKNAPNLNFYHIKKTYLLQILNIKTKLFIIFLNLIYSREFYTLFTFMFQSSDM